MIRKITCLFFLLFQAVVYSQDFVNFQAIIIGDDGPLISTDVEIELVISEGGTDLRQKVFSEKHSSTTNDIGLVKLKMGLGEVIEGSWGSIDWSSSDLWLETYLIKDGDSQMLSATSLGSSPKALFSAISGTVQDGSITQDKIAKGAITLDKLADDIVLPRADLTKEDIVALGIPPEDTNTTYSAGVGIVIVNDTVQVASEVVREIDGIVAAEKFKGDGSELTNLKVEITDNFITTNMIADESITASKLSVTKEDIVALGIPSEDTNTAYSAGKGITISNDSILLSSNVPVLEDDQLEINSVTLRNNENALIQPDLDEFDGLESFLEDYHYFLGLMNDSISRLIVSESFNEFSSVKNLQAENVSALNLGAFRLEMISEEEAAYVTIAPAKVQDTDVLDVSGGIVANRFFGDGSGLTNLNVDTPDLENNYIPFKGVYIQHPNPQNFTDFETQVENNLLPNEAFSNLDNNELSNFGYTYLDDPTQDLPLVIGKAGSEDDPKGIVYATSIAGVEVAASRLRADEINSQSTTTESLTTDSITTSSGSELFRTIVNDDDTIETAVTANRFFGDGSGLTGIVPSIADNSIIPSQLKLDEDPIEIAHSYMLSDGVTLSESDDLEELFWEDWDLFIDTAYDQSSNLFESFGNWFTNSNFRYYHGPTSTFTDNTYFLRTDLIAAYQLLAGDLTVASITLGPDFGDSYAYVSETEGVVTQTNVLELGSKLIIGNLDGDGPEVIYQDEGDVVVVADTFIGDGSQLSGVSADILDSSITSSKIADAVIVNSHISSDAAIDFSKLAITKADIEGLGITSVSNLNDLPNFYNTVSNNSLLIDALREVDDTNFNYASRNIGLGFDVFPSLTKGDYNISLGYSALSDLTVGRQNIAVGMNSLGSISGDDTDLAVGSYNIGMGYAAGYRVTTGGYNIAIGYQSLSPATNTYEYSGNYNIAIGPYSGLSNLNYTGENSIFIGYAAGPVSAESEGIAIGKNAKIENGAIALGNNAQAWESESIAIGNKAYAEANTLALGGMYNESAGEGIKIIVNTGAEMLFSKYTTMSDMRLKDDIQSIANALDITSRLKPVYYSKRRSLASEIYEDKEYGFIAQEVQEILPELVKDTGGDDHVLSLDYNSIIAILTKAVQEQQSEIDELKKMVQQLLDQKDK